MVRCRCFLVYDMFDDVRGGEVHIVSVYNDGGHWVYFLLDDMFYVRCHNSSMCRNGKFKPDLLVPCKFNRYTDVFVKWSVVK
jgi:hypothetical protein